MIGPPWYSSLAVPDVASAEAGAPRSGCTLSLWPLGRLRSSAEALPGRLTSIRAAAAKPAKASRPAPRRAISTSALGTSQFLHGPRARPGAIRALRSTLSSCTRRSPSRSLPRCPPGRGSAVRAALRARAAGGQGEAALARVLERRELLRRAVHRDAPAEHRVLRVGDRVGDALGRRRRVREVFGDRADAFLQIARPVRPRVRAGAVVVVEGRDLKRVQAV